MDSYCTLLFSADYIPGALVLGESLRKYDPDINRIILVTENISPDSRVVLGKLYHQVRLVEPITTPQTHELELLNRPNLATACTKLRIWQLTDYKRIIYLDADTLPMVSLAHLFDELPLGKGIAAAPDIGWPDIFNSGVFVAEPSSQIFSELEKLVHTGDSFDGSDQGLLNTYFKDWHRLSFTYNVTASASYQYAPAYERFKNDIKVFHFIGAQKPWNSLSSGEMVKKWHEVGRKVSSDVDVSPPLNIAQLDLEQQQTPIVDEKKLVHPSPNRWDPVNFEPPLNSEPEASAFDESRSVSEEPPAFEFMQYGPAVSKFPWESNGKPASRVFSRGYD